jgi:hypothetical protein
MYVFLALIVVSIVELTQWPKPMLWESVWGKYYYMGFSDEEAVQSPTFKNMQDCIAWGQGLSLFQQNIVGTIYNVTVDDLAWKVATDPNAWTYRVKHPRYECTIGIAGVDGSPLYSRKAK